MSKRRWDPVSLRAQGCGCLPAQYEHYKELEKRKPDLQLFEGMCIQEELSCETHGHRSADAKG